MVPYVVTHAGRENSEPFSNYLFDVSQAGLKVAELSHDYRGDAQWIRTPGGKWNDLPGRILQGGGPEPLALTASGVKAVDQLVG